MFGHDDFQSVRDMWRDFWTGGNKRPVYAITIPKNGKEPAPFPPYLAGFNGEYQAVADRLAEWVESCEFYGGAIPRFNLSFGSDDFASFLGADLRIINENTAEATSWPSHTLTTLKDAKIAFDPNGKWWSRAVEFHDVLKRTLGESVMIAAPTISAGLDGLVGLYGANNLLTDLADEPELVKDALCQINAAYTEVLLAMDTVFEFGRYGSINRHGMYTAGRINVPQCDFSCMISPAMFEEFAIPSLVHEFSLLDAGEYHLDGPDAIRHLDRIAEIPGLKVIQWVPGVGEAAAMDWTSLYHKIVSLGKGLILGGTAEAMEAAQRAYRTPNMFLSIYGVKSPMEAEDTLCRMEKLWEEMEEGKA